MSIYRQVKQLYFSKYMKRDVQQRSTTQHPSQHIHGYPEERLSEEEKQGPERAKIPQTARQDPPRRSRAKHHPARGPREEAAHTRQGRPNPPMMDLPPGGPPHPRRARDRHRQGRPTEVFRGATGSPAAGNPPPGADRERPTPPHLMKPQLAAKDGTTPDPPANGEPVQPGRVISQDAPQRSGLGETQRPHPPIPPQHTTHPRGAEPPIPRTAPNRPGQASGHPETLTTRPQPRETPEDPNNPAPPPRDGDSKAPPPLTTLH
nr:basic salivary proline-rich protein 1-like [Paramormyrops kingsleyae]